ncbi:MAG: helix-turn-helix transcriptional regulator [Polyangiaceae bacterium]|nr:helix-turn-helix transcriptional regulator [Polyangiaceae bacterium]
MNTDQQLDLVFAALSDPTRRAILARLAEGDATLTELAAPFDLAQPTVSRHLRVLEDAGLVNTQRDKQRRWRSLVIGGPLAEVDTWLAPFRAQWERRFDRLENFLARAESGPAKPKNVKQPSGKQSSGKSTAGKRRKQEN